MAYLLHFVRHGDEHTTYKEFIYILQNESEVEVTQEAGEDGYDLSYSIYIDDDDVTSLPTDRRLVEGE